MKRPIPMYMAGLIAAWLSLCLSAPASAAEIRIAVASNFAHAIRDLARHFEQQGRHKVALIFGSTGKHYAQIKNGAPFDAYFAADAKRPQLLDNEGVALAGSRFTYAIGKLALWSPQADYVDPAGKVLEQGDFRHLSVANPKLAPYGRAAREVLEKLGYWHNLRGRMVRGENIGQTFQFVKSGNAELGFVAWSQIKQPGRLVEGSWWDVPQALYTPIIQQAVTLKDNAAVHDFMSYMRSDEALKIIQAYGYGTH